MRTDMYIPRLRRINDVIAEVKKADPQTELNWKLLQQLAKSGIISCLKYGNSWLINLDELYGVFTNKGEKK